MLTLLFNDLFSELLLGAIGLYSPYPAADNLPGSIFLSSIKYLITVVALVTESSQLVGNLYELIGMLSVCPSTIISLSNSLINKVILSKIFLLPDFKFAFPESKRILSLI